MYNIIYRVSLYKSYLMRTVCCVSAIMLLVFSFAACSSIDCTMNNSVYTNYSLRTPDGKVDTLKLTCTISTNRTDGSDSVLINKDTNITQFSLPISNAHPCDSFFVELSADDVLSLDTVVVEKEDHMHFESTDCAASFFHDITGVSTTHYAIDSVAVVNHEVTYDTSKKHFYIYFTPRNQ